MDTHESVLSRFEAVFDRFEAAWQQGESPDLTDYLPDSGDAQQRQAALLELVCIDLEYHWQQKQDGRAIEEYVSRFPELAASKSSLKELALQEYNCRLRAGDRPNHQTVLARFPELREDLALALEQADTDFTLPPGTANRSLMGTKSQRQGRGKRRLNLDAGQKSTDLPLDQQGHYELRKELARGGMGCVYVGYDCKLDREVAIKTLLPQADPSRFIIESKITAKLPHPGIPPAYTLGELSDGSPFLAMKLVRGETLQEALRKRDNLKQDQAAFIQVFEQIAQAVGFAHSQSVIHRDLKPANIMVGDFGEVQVMDWGLAKVLTGSRSEGVSLASQLEDVSEASAEMTCVSHTEAGAIMGTPSYMAPEQAAAKQLDGRCDVFALGGILTTILTGKPVFSGRNAWEVVQSAAAGETQAALSQLDNCSADSELVNITKKCLAVDPQHRPADGHAVAELIGAYRQGVENRLRLAEADRAAAEATAEEQSKRRRVVQMGAGVIAAVLLLGIVGTSFGLMRAEHARAEAVAANVSESRRAEAERAAKEEAKKQTSLAMAAAAQKKEANELTMQRLAEIEKINDTVFDIFEGFDIDEVREGDDPIEYVLAERLIKAGEELDADVIRDPVVLAKLQNRLGRTLLSLGRPQEAIGFLMVARDIRTESLGADHPNTVATISSLARGYLAVGKTDLALPLCEEALKLTIAKLGTEHPYTLTAMNNLASAHNAEMKLDLALPLLQETVKLTKAKLGPEHPATLAAMHNLASAYISDGKLELALPLFQQTLKLMKAKLGPEHPHTLTDIHNLALAHAADGKLDLALPLWQETVKLMKAKLGPDHPHTLSVQINIAISYFNAGQLDKAIPLYAHVLERRVEVLGFKHPDTQLSLSHLLGAIENAGKDVATEETLRKTLTWLEEEQPDHWQAHRTQLALGRVLTQKKSFSEAEPLLLTGLRGLKKQSSEIPELEKNLPEKAFQAVDTLYEAWEKPEKASAWRSYQKRLLAGDLAMSLRDELKRQDDFNSLPQSKTARNLDLEDMAKAGDVYRKLVEQAREKNGDLLPRLLGILALIEETKVLPSPLGLPVQPAKKKNWSQASQQYQELMKASPGGHYTYCLAGGCFLLAGQDEAFRDFRRQAVNQFRDSFSYEVLERISKNYFLAPVTVEERKDAQQAEAMATLALQTAQTINTSYLPYFQTTAGLAALRMGRPQEAIKLLEARAKQPLEHGVTTGAVLVLALHNLHRVEEATELMGIVAANHNKLKPNGGNPDWLIAEVLFREAEEALHSGSAKTGAPRK